jgi:aryl-alcohol dehydrogenase-like predicted oxidoreductase
VSVVIPGARNADQAKANAVAAQLDPLTDDTLAAVERIYDERIRVHVHDRW